MGPRLRELATVARGVITQRDLGLEEKDNLCQNEKKVYDRGEFEPTILVTRSGHLTISPLR